MTITPELKMSHIEEPRKRNRVSQFRSPGGRKGRTPWVPGVVLLDQCDISRNPDDSWWDKVKTTHEREKHGAHSPSPRIISVSRFKRSARWVPSKAMILKSVFMVIAICDTTSANDIIASRWTV